MENRFWESVPPVILLILRLSQKVRAMTSYQVLLNGLNLMRKYLEVIIKVISVIKRLQLFQLCREWKAIRYLKDVSLEGFTSSDGIYRNQSLQSEKAQVLLFGTITGQPSQPMLWINNTGKNNVIYTSMGSVRDWKNESFRQIMKNSVSYLLDQNLNK